MKAVILAGGYGTRIAEETDHIPKPMVKVGGKPILWHIMKSFSHYGINEFVVCLGYKGEVVKDYFLNYYSRTSDFTVDLRSGKTTMHKNGCEDWKITLVDTGLNCMTGGRIRRVKNYLDDQTFCLTYGDGVSDINIENLISFHKRHKKKATVTAISPPGRFGVLNTNLDDVYSFGEKIDNLNQQINGGFFVLEPDIFDLIENDDTVWEQFPMKTLAKQGELKAYKHNGFWMAMDTLRDHRVLEDLWDQRKADWAVWL